VESQASWRRQLLSITVTDWLPLLEALSFGGIHTPGDVAKHLGVPEGAAESLLSRAESAGLVIYEPEQSRGRQPTFDRDHWHLTPEGLAELHRLHDAPGR
jgi:DNA-binding MarR family transcriptional regulator